MVELFWKGTSQVKWSKCAELVIQRYITINGLLTVSLHRWEQEGKWSTVNIHSHSVHSIKGCHLLKCPLSASPQIPTHFYTAKHKERGGRERERAGRGGGKVVKHSIAYSCSTSLFLGYCTGLQLKLSNPTSEIFQRQGEKVGHPLSFDRAAAWHQATLQEFCFGHLKTVSESNTMTLRQHFPTGRALSGIEAVENILYTHASFKQNH